MKVRLDTILLLVEVAYICSLWKPKQPEIQCLTLTIISFFCPKYRRNVFTGDIAKYLEQFFRKQVEKKGWTLTAIEVRPDHIHLFIEGISPIIRLSDVAKYLKGTSGLAFFRVFRSYVRGSVKGRYGHVVTISGLRGK